MIDYRLFPVNNNGRVIAPPVIITCADDKAALIEAKNYLGGHALEVWRQDTRIAVIPALKASR